MLELFNDYPVDSLYSEEEYKEFIDLLIDLIINKFKHRYPHLDFLNEASIDAGVLLSEQLIIITFDCIIRTSIINTMVNGQIIKYNVGGYLWKSTTVKKI